MALLHAGTAACWNSVQPKGAPQGSYLSSDLNSCPVNNVRALPDSRTYSPVRQVNSEHCLVTDLSLLLCRVQLLHLPCSRDGGLVHLRVLGQPLGLQSTRGRLDWGARARSQAKQDSTRSR